MKESDAFALLPGGFGTLDEAFELLTLLQTGKAQPAPVILLDVPDGTYWQGWRAFVEDELAGRGYISKRDLSLLKITDDVEVAIEEMTRFYANYQSLRFVEGRLVMRMLRAPDDEMLARLNEEFADIVVRGGIERVEVTPAEQADDDHVDLERIAFRFDRHDWARLRELIDTLNTME